MPAPSFRPSPPSGQPTTTCARPPRAAGDPDGQPAEHARALLVSSPAYAPGQSSAPQTNSGATPSGCGTHGRDEPLAADRAWTDAQPIVRRTANAADEALGRVARRREAALDGGPPRRRLRQVEVDLRRPVLGNEHVPVDDRRSRPGAGRRAAAGSGASPRPARRPAPRPGRRRSRRSRSDPAPGTARRPVEFSTARRKPR